MAAFLIALLRYMVRPARRTWQSALYRSISRRQDNCGRFGGDGLPRETIALAKFLIGKILVRDGTMAA